MFAKRRGTVSPAGHDSGTGTRGRCRRRNGARPADSGRSGATRRRDG
jgi:hypothetical protein